MQVWKRPSENGHQSFPSRLGLGAVRIQDVEWAGILIPVSTVPGLVHVTRATEDLVGRSLTMLPKSGKHSRPSKDEFVKFETSSRMLLFYS